MAALNSASKRRGTASHRLGCSSAHDGSQIHILGIGRLRGIRRRAYGARCRPFVVWTTAPHARRQMPIRLVEALARASGASSVASVRVGPTCESGVIGTPPRAPASWRVRSTCEIAGDGRWHRFRVTETWWNPVMGARRFRRAARTVTRRRSLSAGGHNRPPVRAGLQCAPGRDPSSKTGGRELAGRTWDELPARHPAALVSA
jgi:hypothetical protein